MATKKTTKKAAKPAAKKAAKKATKPAAKGGKVTKAKKGSKKMGLGKGDNPS